MLKKLFLPVLLLMLGLPVIRADQDIAIPARQTLAANEHSLVTIRLTLKADFGGHSSESKEEAMATVIDPCGLAVTALSTLNGGSRKLQTSGVQMRLSDGTEIPARIVLKDEDLDLAYLAPETALSKEDAVKIAVLVLTDAATKVEPADQCFFLLQLGKRLNYAPSIVVARIITRIATPRLVYAASVAHMGCPAFNGQGQLIGFYAQLKMGEGRAPVILPAAQIVRNVAQAKEEMLKPVVKEAPTTEPAPKDESKKKVS